MPTLDITDDHRDRIESLRAELAAAHAGPYASVDTDDTLAYLLDLADAVDDPHREASADALAGEAASSPADGAESDTGVPFDRESVRERLAARNRKHGDPDAADAMDLYSIAAAFDVTGRSGMTKAALIDAILDAAAAVAAGPFSRVDVDIAGGEGAADVTDEAGADEADDGSAASDETDETDDETDETDDETDETDDETDDTDDTDDAGANQLNAMMSLLDTHEEKWRKADGDARYEVELPDGDVETARTKDDVRALLFKNY